MKLKKVFLIIAVLCVGVILAPVPVWSQEYDYHREESPAVSWNGVSFFDARMLAAGGVSLMASPAFAAAINPAMIPADNKTIIGASFELTWHQAFQYWGINQGVYADPNPQTGTSYYPGGITLSFPVKSLRFSAGWYTPNLLELPTFEYDGQNWGFSVKSKGKENALFAAAAVKLGKIDFGVKVDYVLGKRDVEVDDNWKSYPARILQTESHRLSYLAVSIGAVLELSPAWTVGAALVYPFEGTAKRTIDRIFESDYEHIEILGLESTDTLFRPTRIVVGTSFAPGNKNGNHRDKKLIFAAEAVYTHWADYQYEFYSEIVPRGMENTLTLGLGMEYNFRTYSVRFGYRYDPQPVVSPETTLYALTGGLGLRLGKLSLDLGAAFYFSNYRDTGQKHLVLVSTAYIPLGGE